MVIFLLLHKSIRPDRFKRVFPPCAKEIYRGLQLFLSPEYIDRQMVLHTTCAQKNRSFIDIQFRKHFHIGSSGESDYSYRDMKIYFYVFFFLS